MNEDLMISYIMPHMGYEELLNMRGVNRWFAEMIEYYLGTKGGKWNSAREWLEGETQQVVNESILRGEKCWDQCITETGKWFTGYRILWGTLLARKGKEMNAYWHFKKNKCMKRGAFIRRTGKKGKEEWGAYVYEEWGKVSNEDRSKLRIELKLAQFLEGERDGNKLITLRQPEEAKGDATTNWGKRSQESDLGTIDEEIWLNFEYYDNYEGRLQEVNDRGVVVREIWLG